MASVAAATAREPKTEEEAPVKPEPRMSTTTTTTPATPEASPATAAAPAAATPLSDEAQDCIFCLSTLPHDNATPSEWEYVARLDPCGHYMHNNCLQPWIERANTCPICRAVFNEVEVAACVQGEATLRYEVEDKIQSVADTGLDAASSSSAPASIPPPAATPAASTSLPPLTWEDAWEFLDRDIARWRPTLPDRSRSWRMDRRRAVATAQHSVAAWTIPTTRPREVFPHLQPHMSAEERDSWRMFELASRLEQQPRNPKHARDADSDDPPAPSAPARKFKRPRTKRDSALQPTPRPPPPPPDTPPAPGSFTSLLAAVGRKKDVPIIAAADVRDRDLGRMRPVAPPSPSPPSSPEAVPRFWNISTKEKTEIMKLVAGVLRPLYPATVSKDEFTEINRRVSRWMYRLVGERGRGGDRGEWRRWVEGRVQEEVRALAGRART